MKFWLTKFSYPFKHWLASIAIGPILYLATTEIVNGSFEVRDAVPFFLLFMLSFAAAALCSLPFFVIYISLYRASLRYIGKPLYIKIFLNAMAIGGAALSIRLVLGPESNEVSIYFAMSIVISSFFFKVKPDLFEGSGVGGAM